MANRKASVTGAAVPITPIGQDETATINIHRNVINNVEFNQMVGRTPTTDPPLKEQIKDYFTPPKKINKKKMLHRYLPITDWLFNYNLKSDLVWDIIAGVTIAIMHIPQGIAYALLAETSPIVGIYTAVFPVIIYILLGPSRHVSIGTNPLTSILVGQCVLQLAGKETFGVPSGARGANLIPRLLEADPITGRATTSLTAAGLDKSEEIVVALSLLSGLWQVIFYIFGLGRFSWVMSSVLVNGYTCGAAFHVATSQIKGIFGIKIENHETPWVKIIYPYIDLFKKIEQTNIAALIISIICIAVLILNNEVLKPKLQKYCRFPVPIQLIVVVFATLISYLADFGTKYEVDIIGEVPAGFRVPTAPNLDNISDLILPSLIIAIVGYCVTLSMAKIFAEKFEYPMNGNQELLAEGSASIFGAFFQSLPAGASMSRSMVQVNVGGKTQLTSVVSVSLLIFVILFIGPLFQSLPKAVLSSIIIVALKGMFWQLKDLPKFWEKSKLDGVLWVVSFLAVIILDIDKGLVVGAVFALGLLIYRTIHTPVLEMGYVDKGMFSTMDEAEKARRLNSATIFRLAGPINFGNFESVLNDIRRQRKPVEPSKAIVLDLSSVPYIDQTAGAVVKTWMDKQKATTRILLASANHTVESMLLKCGVSIEQMFPTVLDAVSNLEDLNSLSNWEGAIESMMPKMSKSEDVEQGFNYHHLGDRDVIFSPAAPQQSLNFDVSPQPSLNLDVSRV